MTTETTGLSMDEIRAQSWTPSVDQSTGAVHDPAVDLVHGESTAQSIDAEIDRITADLDSVRRRSATYRRAVVGFTIAVIVVVGFAMGTAAAEVQKFAAAAGFSTFSSWALDPVVGLALIVLMVGEALIADANGKAPRGTAALRHFAGLVTLAMNCWPSCAAGRWDSVVLHAVMPGLLIGFAAVAPKYRRVLASLTADLRAEELRLLQRRDDHEAARARQAKAREEAAAQAVLDRLASERADAEREARAQRWRDEEASRQRVQEARELAEIEAIRLAAQAEADRARAAANAAGNRTKDRPPPARTAVKKPTSLRTPSKETAVRIVAEAIRAHEGPKPFTLDWEAMQTQHGGGRAFWFDALKQAKQPPHLASAETA